MPGLLAAQGGPANRPHPPGLRPALGLAESELRERPGVRTKASASLQHAHLRAIAGNKLKKVAADFLSAQISGRIRPKSAP